MKNLWKLAAALVAIAGAIVVIVKFGNRILEKLEKLCPCRGKCDAPEAVKEAPAEEPAEESEATEAPAEEPAEAAEAPEAEEAAAAEPAPEEVTPEDFAD